MTVKQSFSYFTPFQNVSIGVVGLEENFHILSEDETEKYLGNITARKPRGDGGDDPSVGPGSSQPPSIDDAVQMEEPTPDPIPDVAVEQRQAPAP